jgi:GxxExxY protein
LKTPIDQLTEKVIGAAMEVHRILGPGFLESVYQNALAVELTKLGISFRQQASLSVSYKGAAVGDFVADILIEDCLILELKSVLALASAHEVQLVNYLTATGCETGLLINFGAPSLQFRRKFKAGKNPVNSVNSVQKINQLAFTIIELLVAMAVMSVLLVLLLNMVDSATKLWRENENRVDAYREARAALGIMSRDLRNALTGATNTNHFLVNSTAFPNLSSVSSLVTDTNQGAALFFLSALPSKAQDSASNRSDVCQVGYFLAYGKSSSASNSPISTLNIYRYILSSDPTFARLTNASPPLFISSLTTLDPKVELLARNVTRFTAKAYTLTNNALVDFVASTGTPMPDVVELSISAINQDTGKKLGGSFSDWTSTNSATYTNLVGRAEQTFTTRINLNRPR